MQESEVFRVKPTKACMFSIYSIHCQQLLANVLSLFTARIRTKTQEVLHPWLSAECIKLNIDPLSLPSELRRAPAKLHGQQKASHSKPCWWCESTDLATEGIVQQSPC